MDIKNIILDVGGILFDDSKINKEKNVIASSKIGIKSVVFNSINDMKDAL